jgi:hypothetical protein
MLALMVSIVLQSFVISADNTEFHELTVDHTQVEVDHVHIGYVSSLTTFDVDSTDIVPDCHHCGHCTSAQLSWDIKAPASVEQYHKDINGFALQNFALKDIFETRLRPPIV